MSKIEKLKVSVITITTEDRVDFNNRIMRIFSEQDYPDKEHIVLYGPESIGQKKEYCLLYGSWGNNSCYGF